MYSKLFVGATVSAVVRDVEVVELEVEESPHEAKAIEAKTAMTNFFMYIFFQAVLRRRKCLRPEFESEVRRHE